MEHKVCTKENPYKEELGVYWQHPEADTVDSSCDCCEAYLCPNCGLRFKVELPE